MALDSCQNNVSDSTELLQWVQKNCWCLITIWRNCKPAGPVDEGCGGASNCLKELVEVLKLKKVEDLLIQVEELL